MTQADKLIRPKRTYVKLSSEEWKEIVMLYSSGTLTLAEISRRFGVSTRNIQIYIDKARKQASTPSPSALMKKSMPSAPTPTELTPESHSACMSETRASVYADAVTLQTLLHNALADLENSPELPFTARVRAFDQAAVALERVHKIRRVVLGMGREDDSTDRPLPELPIRMLTEAEIKTMRKQQTIQDGASIGNLVKNERDGSIDSEGEIIEE